MSDWEEECEPPAGYNPGEGQSFMQSYGGQVTLPLNHHLPSVDKVKRYEDQDQQRRRPVRHEWKSCESREKFQNDEQTMTLYIDSSDVGRVIGRGGQKIREMEEKSKAVIKVRRSGRGDQQTKVDITGSLDAQLSAKLLIEGATSQPPRPSSKGSVSTSSTRSVDSNRSMPTINWSKINERRAEEELQKWKGLPAVKKHFYIEDPSVAKMSASEVCDFRLNNSNISVVNLSDSCSSRPVPNPVATFKQAFYQYPEIFEMCESKFSKPTPIQCQSWPILMQGFDMVGIAQTGTGKTLAFLLPAFVHIDGQDVPRKSRGGPTALILSPTRELALQIEAESKKYSYKGIRCACLYGGGSRKDQIDKVSAGLEIVIATPGRLNDLIMNELISVRSVSYLVLDEADRMLDMGFEPQIKKILLDIRPDRQTVMTSATWPPDVRRLSLTYMKDPFQVCVGTLDLKACALVEQTIEFLDQNDKLTRTFEFVKDMREDEKVLIFTSRKTTADHVASEFTLEGIKVQSIHGDREQYDREQALEDFKTGEVSILVATDVASRGLDVKDITHVVNFDFPNHIEDYVHRVGRTGRAGRKGKALTFITRENWRWARELCNVLAQANQTVPQELIDMAERYEAMRARKEQQFSQRH